MISKGKIENKSYVYGIYSHEDQVLHALDHLNHNGVHVDDAYSPFPIHGIDDKLGAKDTSLHTAGFVLGLTGTVTALSLITWVTVVNYPTLFGGKPFWSLPAFIPITFELTVLMSAVGMFFVYIKRNELFPGKIPMMVDERTTDDKFALAIGLDGKSDEAIEELKAVLTKSGAEEVHVKSFE
jgi:hypothetical protein